MRGFTLIESIVTVAIITIIAAITMVSYSNIKTQSALNRAVQKVAVDIRKAQNWATVTLQESGGSAPCGYGIHYESINAYILFADQDPGADPLCAASNKIFDIGEGIDTIKMEQQKVKFSSPFLDVLFFPPDPLVFINGVYNPGAQNTIALCFENDCGASFRRIIVWGTGLIDIE